MKTLYDYQASSLQKYGGVSQYYLEIIRGVKKTLLGK
jgi:hypothetical protein